jgi:hypothetical protein
LQAAKVRPGRLFLVLYQVFVQLSFDTVELEFQIFVNWTLVKLVEFHLSDKSLEFEFAFEQGGFERLRVRFHGWDNSGFLGSVTQDISLYGSRGEKRKIILEP